VARVSGAIVTIDAIGTQKKIAAKIIDKGADYFLALKTNQGSLHDDVEDFFADPAFFHKPLLPAPNTSLGLVGLTHDFRRADTVGAQKNDGRPPHMFLGGIAVLNRSFVRHHAIGTLNGLI